MTYPLFDPLAAQIDAISDEAPIPQERLAVQWLRDRFTSPPLWVPENTDEIGFLQQQSNANARHASVLLPLVLREERLQLLLTRRASHMHTHANQISFPGGRQEPTDASAVETALREAQEEIGLHPRHVEIIGLLPEYWTNSGYRITPVVGVVQPPVALQPNPEEVEEIFEVPLDFLMNGMNHQRRTAYFPNGSRTFYAMHFDRFFIWGVTATILRNLFHLLRA